MGFVISILVIWIINARKLLAHQWKGQIQRQFTIVTKIITTIYVVHFQNELNPKRSLYSNWSCNYSLPVLSPTFILFTAFHTICYSLAPLNQLISLACAKISPVFILLKFFQNSPSLSDLSACHFILHSTRSYPEQTNLNLLSKHCNLHLKCVTFCRRVLFATQTNQYQILFCHSTATNHCSTFSVS